MASAVPSRRGICGATLRQLSRLPRWAPGFPVMTIALFLCWTPSIHSAPSVSSARNTVGADAERTLALAIARVAHPVAGRPSDYDHLLRRIGNARGVLLGEDTHGTREFYRARARITQRLIAEHGFAGLVIEADWTEVAGLRAYTDGAQAEADVDHALQSFQRFPRWMWHNTDFRDLVAWLGQFNRRRAAEAPAVGLYGMDLQEIAPAARTVIGYLGASNTEAAQRATARYGCLDSGDGSGQDDAQRARWPGIDCAQPVQEQLTELSTAEWPGQTDGAGSLAGVAHLHALQSARSVRNAEEYYRPQRDTPQASWNVRDGHMAATIDLLLAQLDTATGRRSRLVVWAHNAHIGDARGTARGDAGWQTIGQMMRERYPEETTIVGFTTATGRVRAATDWGGRDGVKSLRRPVRGSHGALLHATGLRRFYLIADESAAVAAALDVPKLQRGVGVRYLPKLEREGHYYHARLSRQFDVLVHFDRTHALRPLRMRAPGHSGGN